MGDAMSCKIVSRLRVSTQVNSSDRGFSGNCARLLDMPRNFGEVEESRIIDSAIGEEEKARQKKAVRVPPRYPTLRQTSGGLGSCSHVSM